MRAVGGRVYNDFTAKLLYNLYRLASVAIVESGKLSETERKRVKREKSLVKSEEFKSLPKLFRGDSSPYHQICYLLSILQRRLLRLLKRVIG